MGAKRRMNIVLTFTRWTQTPLQWDDHVALLNVEMQMLANVLALVLPHPSGQMK